ncbi:MAG TPA: carboxymuconolactone decarboxylase family protein [Acidimicrobiales bacterium]|jgi:4-carboxymuconolactone decarboxylase|nr:carboxymuconolactone decarboxylase family protein [Acidimicrobiales bacterium]
MDRLAQKARSELGDEGQVLYDSLVESRGDHIASGDGALLGPFNAWVQAPRIGSRLAALGSALRYDMALDRKLIELAIITVGSYFKAEFEWFAHSAVARRHGVPEAVISSLAAGQEPACDDFEQRIVYTVASELVRTGGLSEATHREAQGVLPDEQLIELVTLCGYYTLVSFTLNAFDVALPPGTEQQWDTSD